MEHRPSRFCHWARHHGRLGVFVRPAPRFTHLRRVGLHRWSITRCRVTIAREERRMRFLIYWIISAISLIISAYVARALGLDVRVDLNHPLQLMLGVLLLGLVNATI